LLNEKHVAYQSLDKLTEKIDYIYDIDVLEHIEDDLGVLKKIYSALPDKGKVLIYVPARPELYSSFDKKIGHFRRYTLSDLKQKILAAGFSINLLKYHDFLGYFAAYYNKLFFKDDGRLNVHAVKFYDQFLVPSSNFIEKLLVHPFIGKDILLVASK
jgi:SAM-dependent methyltransferase